MSLLNGEHPIICTTFFNLLCGVDKTASSVDVFLMRTREFLPDIALAHQTNGKTLPHVIVIILAVPPPNASRFPST